MQARLGRKKATASLPSSEGTPGNNNTKGLNQIECLYNEYRRYSTRRRKCCLTRY